MMIGTVCISTEEYIELRKAAEQLALVKEACEFSGDVAAWAYLSADERRMEKYAKWCQENGAIPF